ncbi:MAG: pseudouridine synthase [Crocinitomicaceae bacterium]
MKKYHYFKIYKPYGMLSQFSKTIPEEYTLKDLGFDFPKDVYPVGRLDKDSEGLLMLTNDQHFQQRHTDPKSEIEKTYWVQLDGQINKEALERFEKGNISIKLKTGIYTCKKAKARMLESSEFETIPDRNPPIRFRKNIPTSWVEIKLTEGKNRQIRKMTAQIGFPTLRLIRVQSGSINIPAFHAGDVQAFVLD